jgi:VWFA-related protein
VFLCTSVFTQIPEQEVSSTDNAATFQFRVNLVTVPVVVRDRNGNAVGNLKKEDFRLFDKGKQQVISKVSVEKSTGQPAIAVTTPAGADAALESTPASIPTRFVAYVFDDLHTEFGDLAAARNAADQHIERSCRGVTARRYSLPRVSTCWTSLTTA